MRVPLRRLLVAGAVTATLVLPLGAAAAPLDAVASFTYSQNMHPLGHSARTVPLAGAGSGQFNTDLAFWGDTVFQGTYTGFRIVDVSSPANPVVVEDFSDCVAGSTAGNQGDVLVWGNILIRSWNSPAGTGGRFCGNLFVPQGQEGLHVFDISDPANPVGLKFVPLQCGSHTATLVPDAARGNVYVYNSASSGTCPGIDIVRIPLADPTQTAFVRREPAGRSCHDTSVIFTSPALVSCAGGNGLTTFRFDPSLPADPAIEGSIENPSQIWSRSIPGVSIGHSTSFSWDGAIVVFGHEPGGGGQARCQATSSVVDRTLFFFEAQTGAPAGTIIHPRPQGRTENCTWHNFNVVPTDKRYILVSGNYQSGISVVDFTDPTDAKEIAYADPAPLVHPTNPAAIALGGDWSTYWYNGRIYESDITRGLTIWNLSDDAVAGAMKLGHSNPQTQELSFPFKGTAFGRDKAKAEAQFAAAVAGAEVTDGEAEAADAGFASGD